MSMMPIYPRGLMPYHRYDSVVWGLGFDFSRIQIYFRYYEGLVNINFEKCLGELMGSLSFLILLKKIDPFNLVEYKLVKKQKKEKQYGRKYAKPQ